MITPRQRVEISLRGGHGSVVPFTMYGPLIPQCSAEREMRNRGLCIVKRMQPYLRHMPNVKVSQSTSFENGKQLTRSVYETPVGSVSQLDEPAGFTTWHHERLFKRPEDYKVICFMIDDAVFKPNYAPVVNAEREDGGDTIIRSTIGPEPMQELISGRFMSTETFCIEWMENRDEVLKLYEANVEQRRKVYDIVAKAPVLHANYGGNVSPEIISPINFEKYYLPNYNEAAEIMHREGKLIGVHFDANCRLFAQGIASSQLDYIEAFTPAPDTDMTLAEARAAWPDKVLWLNYPSSVHLQSDEVVEQRAYDLVQQAGTPDGLIMGITENIPPHRWQNSCRAIMDGLDRHAREHSRLYS